MDSRFKEWVYIEGLMQSAYHEAALKMNLSDSEFWILYVFNFHQEGCNQSVLYKEACLTKSTVNSAIRKMEQKDLLYLLAERGDELERLAEPHHGDLGGNHPDDPRTNSLVRGLTPDPLPLRSGGDRRRRDGLQLTLWARPSASAGSPA